MTDKIQWTEPTEITEQQLRDQTLPWLKKTVRQCNRCMLVIGVIVAPLCYFINGFGFAVSALSTLTLCVYLIPFLIWANIRQGRKAGVKYQVGTRGIQVNRRFFLWRNIEGWSFSTPQPLPNVAVLSIKHRQFKQRFSLPFYRHDVSEQELQAVLERYAPQAAPPTV